MGLGASLAQ
jgi:hypothetical protein